MAVIWTKTTDNTRFEVRTAGRSVRLYTNGVFHSQYNPANPISNTVWSLLLLPAIFQPVGHIQRALVLGVGGGAVIRLLDHVIRPRELVGIELDATHIHIARRFFGVTQGHASLIEADAADWLRRYTGPKFDLIIDDLFVEQDGEPVRAVEADLNWLKTLSKNLTDDGVLVMNFINTQTLRDAHRTLERSLSKRFATAFGLNLLDYENVIGAFTGKPREARQLRQALRSADIRDGKRLSRIPFRIRRL